MERITSSDVLLWTRDFLAKAEKELSPAEVKEQRMFASLVTNPKNKVLLTKLLDESSQIRDTRKLSLRMKKIFEDYGVPAFFGRTYEFLGILFREFGYQFDFIAVPIFKSVLRKETSKIIIKEERPALTWHLKQRWHDNIGQNVNLLGEVVLGDGEADHRFHHYLNALKEPDINYISIKISGIYAQIYPLKYESSKQDLCQRIAAIYQQAIDHPYQTKDGRTKPKFVNLDMEEYKDAELTLDVFTTVMDLPQFKNYMAGIVVQAYLPDAQLFYERLLAFARKRVEEGGSPIKVRLVKGANLQMETIISSLKGWANPVLPTKIDVDANYLHILDIALRPENARVVHIGVASHNFFTIGYAYLLCKQHGVEAFVTFEMLEGMANHLPRVMRGLGKQVILYTPVVRKEHFLNAVSYLVRRLDENTGEDNFLRYSFNLKLHSEHWNFLEQQFLQAYERKDKIVPRAFRTQNRTAPVTPQADIDTFANEPDTNLDLKPNREWALASLARWRDEVRDTNYVIPVQVADQQFLTEKKKKYYDRNRDDSVCVCEVNMATQEQVEQIVAAAQASPWRRTTLKERNELLHRTADIIGEHRGDMIGCMAAITGKTFMEGDVEVSEGIDFCRFYPISMRAFEELPTLTYAPKGTILVIPPWNFPFAIPVGGVVAALAGGNSVILKPATVAFPIAWEFAKCFWEAGVPKDALQLVCPADRRSLDYLSAHPSVKHTILTGGTDTAFKLLQNAPRTPLAAETGGKNAIIVTRSADQDHAIQNIVTSAFSNAGQKCSACSLLLLDRKAFNDPAFQKKLKDAVTSMHTGSAWETDTLVGPMITNDNDKLLHAIDNLEEGEWWLVPPVFVDEKKYILKPTVKWGVKPGSFTFRTELFAPLLAVVCIDSLDEGIRLANSTGYGLTSGLQSLDEDEIERWKNSIEAGNLYINRGITGAIVRRQPFGGMKLSAFGAGIKAGGPNYVSCFVEFTEKPLRAKPEEFIESPLEKLLATEEDKFRFRQAQRSFTAAWKDVFTQEADVSHLVGEENTFRYLPIKSIGIRVQNDDDPVDLLLIFCAAYLVGTEIIASISPDSPHRDLVLKASDELDYFEVALQEEAGFIKSMSSCERIRACSTGLSDDAYWKAAELGTYIAAEKPVAEGRRELLHYLKEQSISYEYHRYGSILEKR